MKVIAWSLLGNSQIAKDPKTVLWSILPLVNKSGCYVIKDQNPLERYWHRALHSRLIMWMETPSWAPPKCRLCQMRYDQSHHAAARMGCCCGAITHKISRDWLQDRTGIMWLEMFWCYSVSIPSLTCEAAEQEGDLHPDAWPYCPVHSLQKPASRSRVLHRWLRVTASPESRHWASGWWIRRCWVRWTWKEGRRSWPEVTFLTIYGYSIQNQLTGLDQKRRMKHSSPGRQNKKAIDPEGSVQEMHSTSIQWDPVSLL